MGPLVLIRKDSVLDGSTAKYIHVKHFCGMWLAPQRSHPLNLCRFADDAGSFDGYYALYMAMCIYIYIAMYIYIYVHIIDK